MLLRSVASLSAVRSSQDVTDGRIMRAGDNARGAALSWDTGTHPHFLQPLPLLHSSLWQCHLDQSVHRQTLPGETITHVNAPRHSLSLSGTVIETLTLHRACVHTTDKRIYLWFIPMRSFKVTIMGGVYQIQTNVSVRHWGQNLLQRNDSSLTMNSCNMMDRLTKFSWKGAMSRYLWFIVPQA